MKTQIVEWPLKYGAAELFELYHSRPGAVLLDSSLVNEMGRYSIIGLNPYKTLEVKDGALYVDGSPAEGSLEETLGAYMAAHYEKNDTGLPMISGAIGYFTYDYGRSFEQIKTRHSRSQAVPDCILNFYDNLIIEDRHEKRLYLTASGMLAEPGAVLDALKAEISAFTPSQEAGEWEEYPVKITSDFEKEAYKKAIDRMIDYIVEGDIYIANMTRRIMAYSGKPPYAMFKSLRENNPSPFGGYFNYGDFQVISASPERFLRMKDGLVETRPIKGTRRRGVTPGEDAALKKELQESGKDKSELLMIVDLERNDLNRVCEPGSVKVTSLFDVETYATVFHLVSNIVGKLRDGLTAPDLLRAAFPGGSITGAPKIRAMEIIDELEQSRRGLYTGSMGYLGLDGSCDLNIVIRTAVYQNGCYTLGVGGGITCESDLEFEYEETEQKARALLEAMK